MEVLYEQRNPLGQENNPRTRLITGPKLGDYGRDLQLEGRFLSQNQGLTLGNPNLLLVHLARQEDTAGILDSLCAEDAPTITDMIQLHLDEESSHQDLYLRKACIQCLLHLNKRYGTLPASIRLSNVTKDGSHPVSGGGFADIWKGRLEDTQTVCLKVLRVYTATYDEKRLLKQLSNEVLLWRQLRHPNILQFLGITEELFQPSYCIVSPWMANGDVISYSRVHESTLDDKVKMLYDISEGVRYLHEHHPPIVHSDIKGLNILVSDGGNCCLADFGLVTIENESPEGQVHLNTSQAVVRGSVPWLAPELMNPEHIGVPSRTTRDIYALGCTIFELLTGNAPFAEKKMNIVIMMEVLNGSRPVRPPDCPDWLWAVVESCWREDFEMRPSAAEVASRLAWMTSQREPYPMGHPSCLSEDVHMAGEEGSNSEGYESGDSEYLVRELLLEVEHSSMPFFTANRNMNDSSSELEVCSLPQSMCSSPPSESSNGVQYLNCAQEFSIQKATFNNIQGNQYSNGLPPSQSGGSPDLPQTQASIWTWDVNNVPEPGHDDLDSEESLPNYTQQMSPHAMENYSSADIPWPTFDDQHSSTGCFTCRVRRKKCDEQQGESSSSCQICRRLRIPCYWPSTRPQWLQTAPGIARFKDSVKASLSQGLIRGSPRKTPHYYADMRGIDGEEFDEDLLAVGEMENLLFLDDNAPNVRGTHRVGDLWDDVSLRDAWKKFRARVGIH